MRVSEKGRAMIQAFEGFSAYAYRDSAGVWTIGYGHTGPDVHDGLMIDKGVAEALLSEDIRKAEALVNSEMTLGILWDKKQQERFDALVSLAFNIPSAFNKRTGLRAAIDDGAPDKVPAQIRRWVYATVNGKKTKLPGLVKRREAEARLFETGVYPQDDAPSPPRPTIRLGDIGPAVSVLRLLLTAHGFYPEAPDAFGTDLSAAVRNFQHAQGLKADGIVGPKTWAALKRAGGEG